MSKGQKHQPERYLQMTSQSTSLNEIEDPSRITMNFPSVRSMSSASSDAKDIPLELSPEPIPPSRSDPLLSGSEDAGVFNDGGGSPVHVPTSMVERFVIWWKESAWPGMGLFGESYLLFSVGTLRPFWEILYPDCFNGDQCSDAMLSSLTYSVVIGVIMGMLIIGTVANTIGRRKGSLTTAALMSIGSLGMTAASFFLSSDPSNLFPSMSLSLFVLGFGIGGEYPLSASTASERAMGAMRRKMRNELEREERIRCEREANAGDAISISTPTRKGGNVVTLQVRSVSGSKAQTRSFSVRSFSSSVKQKQLLDEEEGEMLEKMRENQTRGKRVLLVFTMQGMGIFTNAFTQTFLLMTTGQLGRASDNAQQDDDIASQYDEQKLLDIWRTIYAIGAGVLSYVLISRYIYLEESTVWADDKDRRERVRKDARPRKQLDLNASQGGPNIDINTSGMVGFVPPPLTSQGQSTMALAPNGVDTMSPILSADSSEPVDKAKVFRLPGDPPPPIKTVSTLSSLSVPSTMEQLAPIQNVPSTTSDQDLRSSPNYLLMRNFGWRLFGTSVSWLLWDVAFYGNKLFQSAFLLALTGKETTLFELSAAATLNAFVALVGYFVAAIIVDRPRVGRLRLQQYGFLITGSFFLLCGFLREHLTSNWLVTIYFASSFFGQCGPNATTFLIPAEIFPTEMRTMCHGISASAGKVGALIAAVMFNYADEVQMFLISGYASFVACIVTLVTIPETTTLDLYEIDRKWRMIVDGRKGEYDGLANSPEYLSFYERVKAGLYH